MPRSWLIGLLVLLGCMVLTPPSVSAQQLRPSPTPDCSRVIFAAAVAVPTCTPTPTRTPTRTPTVTPTRTPTPRPPTRTPTPTPAPPLVVPTAVPPNPVNTATLMAGSAVALLVLGVLGLAFVRRPGRPRTAPVLRLNGIKDLGHQSIALDQPAIVFRTLFGSGDDFQWNPPT